MEYRAVSTGGDAMLPNLPRLARHHVERPGLRFEREAFPLPTRFAPKPEFACRGERQPKNQVKMQLVPVPPDPNPLVVFRTEHPDGSGWQAGERFDSWRNGVIHAGSLSACSSLWTE